MAGAAPPAYEDEDLEDEPALQPPARPVQPRRSAASAVGPMDVDNKVMELSRMIRVQPASRQDDLWGSVVCGILLLTVTCLLVFMAGWLLFSPDPDFPFTQVIHNTFTPVLDHGESENETEGDHNETTVPFAREQGDVWNQYEPRGSVEFQSLSDDSASLFCGTKACKGMVYFLEGLFGASHDACGSLYDRVCSSWARSSDRPTEFQARYDADHAVLGAYERQLARLLTSPDVPLPGQRALYADCVSGSLLSEEDLEDITMNLVTPDGGWTPDSLAQAVIQMARIGLSPSFQVSVRAVNGTVYVAFVATDTAEQNELFVHGSEEKSADQSTESTTDSFAGLFTGEDFDNTAFLQSLERRVCHYVAKMSSHNMSCVFSLVSHESLPWANRQLRSVSAAHLAVDNATMFDDLPAYLKEVKKGIEMFSSLRLTHPLEEEQSAKCIRFIDRYIDFRLDLEELTSFYVSLQAYRARVGEAVVIPGTVLNSDSLFLLYYAFDNCRIDDVTPEANGRGRSGSVGKAASNRHGSDEGSSLRRRRVDSVAAMFGGLLLDKCQTVPDLSGCEVEGEERL
ncbi:hypothetical protein V5799_018502 [Amblyomma americanum]|uniref:Uncharacterized protein n=1 Tax=Amblyomma americanum TaxID=6943 RepID=A0AAQ4EZM8_AMBAM